LGVVRNEKLAHFLRFHTMQALLLSIFTFLCLYVFQLVNIPVSAVSVTPDLFLLGVFFSLLFIVVTGACLFSMVQAARGLYAKYPFISEAAYAQTR
ncbi:MAG: Tic20 family protein, partial [Cyanobacteria bacterium J06639_18]